METAELEFRVQTLERNMVKILRLVKEQNAIIQKEAETIAIILKKLAEKGDQET